MTLVTMELPKGHQVQIFKKIFLDSYAQEKHFNDCGSSKLKSGWVTKGHQGRIFKKFIFALTYTEKAR